MADPVTVEGQDAVARKLRLLSKKYGDAAMGALYRQGQFIMADSKEHYVPVDLGNLKATGKVFPPKRQGREITVELAYGDTATPYALAVHEHPSRYSPPSWQGKDITFSPAGSGVKYLERPVLAAIPTLPAKLAKDLSSVGL